MEESNLINNDNTYNTDMSTSQSTIGGNSITNNTLNKDDLQEVTGGGDRGIVTQSTTIVYDTETSQATGTLTPILLILGDGTITDEEPVLLEEDEDITYKAVINSDYESNIPTINLEGSEVSYCDANYVIAITETDKNIPVSYSSTNLSVSFTNNQDWCSVIFKSPLEVADQLKLPLNSDNFTDNSKIIVPVISCEENNTGQERNTTITFNIKNVAISHNIQMNVIQNKLEKLEKLKPIMLYYDNGNYTKLSDCPATFTIKKHNDAITDSSLCVIEIESWGESGIHKDYIYDLFYTNGTKKQIYLGYEDTNKIFTNKLSSVITTQVTTLESDTNGCSAKAYLIQNDNTGAPIKYSLNKCTQDRLITFSYKNTPIFKINQTYDKPGTIITIYVCKLDSLSIGNNTRFALFNTKSHIQIPVNPYESYIQYQEGYQTFVSDYVLMYTEDKKVREGTNIGTLLSTGRLTHLSGHDYLVTQDKYKNLKLANIYNTMQIHHFEGTGPLTSMSATIDMNLYVYAKINSDYYQYMPGNIVNFSNTESSNHLGVYKLQIET